MSLKEIEVAKNKKFEDRTPEERRLANLVPYKPGQSGNPKGRKKGCKNWSTHFQKLMGDPDFLKTIISSTPAQWQDIVGDIPADVIAAGLIANIVKDVAKSISGEKPLSKDTRDAIALLNKIGYGDKIVHEDPDSVFNKPNLIFEVVPSLRNEDGKDAKSDN